eukprot:scaffold3946_cov177-Amphora_coffeaeformis.AAC.4
MAAATTATAMTTTRYETHRTPTDAPVTAASAHKKRNLLSNGAALPGPGYFSSNHVLVNRERARYQRPPLRRSARLDALARQHAMHMADQQHVMSSVASIPQLQAKLQATLVGENTLRGDSIRSMHAEMMQDPQPRNNMLAKGFDTFGMGTAKGEDGKLYLVQLFAGGEPYLVSE